MIVVTPTFNRKKEKIRLFAHTAHHHPRAGSSPSLWAAPLMRRIAARARLIRRGVHVHGSRAFSSYLPSRRISSAEVPTLLLLGSGAALLTTLGRMSITQRGQAESSGAIEEPDPPLGAEDADPEAEEADEEGSLQVSVREPLFI